MAYVKVTAKASGESFEVKSRATAHTSVSTTYRPFYVESVESGGDKSAKKELEGSHVLAYAGVDSPLSAPQLFALMRGVKGSDGDFPSLAIAGYLHFDGDGPYSTLKVDHVELVGKPKRQETQFAPIDYDETVGLGKKKEEAEYTGGGAGFEL